MRILHLTDTHLGGAGAADAFRRALLPAFSGGFDAVLHTGDLFDRSQPPARAIEVARRLLGELARRIPVVVLAGNHDRHGVGRHLWPLPPGLRVVDTPAVVHLPGLRIGCLPHTPDAEIWAAQAAELAARGHDLLACHQSFDGAWVPGFTFRPGRPRETIGAAGLPPGTRLVACGHIHPRQALRIGGAEIVMPGSTIRTSGREGPAPKGTVWWELGAERPWRFVPLPEPVVAPTLPLGSRA